MTTSTPKSESHLKAQFAGIKLGKIKSRMRMYGKGLRISQPATETLTVFTARFIQKLIDDSVSNMVDSAKGKKHNPFKVKTSHIRGVFVDRAYPDWLKNCVIRMDGKGSNGVKSMKKQKAAKNKKDSSSKQYCFC